MTFTRPDPIVRMEQRRATDEASIEAERMLIVAALIDNALAVQLDVEPHEISDLTCSNLWQVARAAVTRGGVFAAGGISKAHPELGKFVAMLVDRYGSDRPAEKGQVAQIRRTIKDAHGRRLLRDLAQGLVDQVDEPGLSPEELLASFIRQSSALAFKATARTKRAIAARIVGELERPPVCYPTGMPGLDRSLGGGFYPGKLYGFGARKKSGKTLLGGTISHNLNSAGVPHLYLSHEMKPDQIEQRSIAREGRFNAMEFLTRRRPALAEAVAEYALNIPDHTLYEHRPGGSIDDDMRILANAVTNFGIKGAFVDYLQIIRGRQKGDSEEQHLGTMAQRFFDFASDNEVFIVIFAQVNQQGNTRGGEGLKNACDAYYTFHRDKDDDRGWLENEEHRYAPYSNVGSEDQPTIYVNKLGPFLEDMTIPPQAAPPEHVPGYDLPPDDGPQYSALKQGGNEPGTNLPTPTQPAR